MEGKAFKVILSLSSLSLFVFFFCFFVFVFLVFCITCVFCFYFESVSFLCFALFNMFFCFQFCLFCFDIKIKKIEKSEKYKNSVCFVYIGTCVPWMAIKINFSKLCISCSLDEHLFVQLCKWVLWPLIVMSKIKLSFVLNTRITLFDGKD